MQSYRIVASLLLVAASATACSENVHPGGPPPNEALSPDLAVSLPQLQQLVELTPTVYQPDAEEGVQLTPEGRAYLAEHASEVPQGYLDAIARGLISRSELDVGFRNDANDAFAQYIAQSRGTEYKNEVELKVRYGTTQIGTSSNVEAESCVCPHIIRPWGRTVSVTMAIEGRCGHIADAKGTATAGLKVLTPPLGLVTVATDQTGDTDNARQPACGESGSDSPGGGGGGDDETWYLCHWADYYDANGEFIRRQDLGCDEINEM